MTTASTSEPFKGKSSTHHLLVGFTFESSSRRCVCDPLVDGRGGGFFLVDGVKNWMFPKIGVPPKWMVFNGKPC